MCVRACVYRYKHTSECMLVEARGRCQVSSVAFYLVIMIGNRGSLWIGSLPILSWRLASKPIDLYLSRLGLEAYTAGMSLSLWMLGIWTQAIELAWSTYWLGHLPSSQCPFQRSSLLWVTHRAEMGWLRSLLLNITGSEPGSAAREIALLTYSHGRLASCGDELSEELMFVCLGHFPMS